MDIVRVKTHQTRPKRSHNPICLILHSTGSLHEGKIRDYYQDNSSGVCPHFLVLRDGRVQQFEELDRIAYHTGMSDDEERWYRAGRSVWTHRDKDGKALKEPYPGYKEWLDRWPKLASPLELPSGAAPNRNSVGIELVAERGQCTDEQYETLAQLILTVAEDLRMELGEDRILTHGWANPIARCDKYGLTDPGRRFDMGRLLGLLE